MLSNNKALSLRLNRCLTAKTVRTSGNQKVEKKISKFEDYNFLTQENESPKRKIHTKKTSFDDNLDSTEGF